MNRREAIQFLHGNKNYSRRMSAKLVDAAILSKSLNTTMAEALRDCIETDLEKSCGSSKKKKKPKFIIKIK